MADNNGTPNGDIWAKKGETSAPSATPKPTADIWAKATPTPAAPKPVTKTDSAWIGTATKNLDTTTRAYQQKHTETTNTILGSILGFAGGIINTVETPLYFIEGMVNEGINQAKTKPVPTTTGLKGVGDSLNYYGQAFHDIIQSGLNNAVSWTQGKPTATGAEILKTTGLTGKAGSGAPIDQSSPLAFVLSLGTDIAADPLTFGLGRVTANTIKAATDAGRASLKAGKMAATAIEVGEEGAVTKIYRPSISEATRLENAPTEITSKTTNYTPRQQPINWNLKTQFPDAIKALNDKIATNYTYKTGATTNRSVMSVATSAIEAGFKAANVRWLQERLKFSLQEEARQAARAARKTARQGGTDYVYQTPETAVASVVAEAPKVTINKTVEDLQPFTPHVVKGKGTYVYDGKYVHQFKTKKEATAWVEDATKAKAPKATIGQRPIVDTKPYEGPKATPLNITDVKQLEKSINAANKVAATAKGITAGEDVTGKIRELLVKNQEQKTLGGISAEFRRRLQVALAGKDSPLYVIGVMAQSKGGDKLAATELMNRVLTTPSGKTYTIKQFIAKELEWDRLDPGFQKQIVEHINNFLTDTKTSATDKLLKQLTDMVGEATAKKIIAAKTSAAVTKILDALPKGGMEKTYSSVLDLIDGLKAGDNIPYATLEKILNHLDPEFKNIQIVAKAAGEKLPYEQLRNILVGRGPQTIFDAERRISLMNIDTFMTADGLAFADTAASYAFRRLNGGEKLDTVTAFERQEASKRIAQYSTSSNPKVRSFYQDALDAIQMGIQSNMDYVLNEVAITPDPFGGISSFGDLAVRSTEKAFELNSRAALVRQMNQSAEARIYGYLLGRITKHGGTPAERLQEAIIKGDIINDILLSVTGGRFTYSKFVAEAEKGAGEAAKHYIFFDLGSTLKLLKESDEALALKAFVPALGKTAETKYNSMSFVGTAKAIRKVVEADEKGTPITAEELISDIMGRAEEQAKWSMAYSKQAPKIAAQLADAITDPKFIEAVKNTHNLRAAAAVEDNALTAETLTEDLISSLFGARLAALDEGIDSVATRNQEIRDWFNKFVYAADIFQQQSGEIAQAVFQAAAQIFIKGGKMEAAAGEAAARLVGSPDSLDAAARQMYADAMESINSYFKTVAPDLYAGPGRERLPFPTTASVAKAQHNLTEAELYYEQIIAQGKTLTTKAQVLAWEKKFAKAQSKLDDARIQAWNNSVPTRHYANGKWIPSNNYDHKLAVAEARRNAEDIVMTETGAVPKSATDTVPKFPSHVKMDLRQSKKWLAEWRLKNNVVVADAHAGIVEEEAQKIINDLPNYENLGLEPADLGERLYQDSIAKPLQAATDEVDVTKLIERMDYNVTPKELPKMSRVERLRSRGSANSGRQNLQPLMVRAESSLKVYMANAAHVAHFLRSRYVKAFGTTDLAVRSENFRRAFRYAISKTDPSSEPELIQKLTSDIRLLIDGYFGTGEQSTLLTSSLDPKHLSKVFKRFGLTPAVGIPELGMKNPKSIIDIINELPFAEMPEKLKGTIEADLWTQRAKAFADSQRDPFVLLSQMATAVQWAKHEQALINDFHTRFGWKNYFNTAEEATAAGWVQIDGRSISGINMAEFLPTPAEGGLFDPTIVKEFASVNREWNSIMYGESLPKFIGALMEFTGFLKETQTIYTLRHHITNMMGDTSFELLNGTVNPRHWATASRMAVRYAKDDAAVKWSRDFTAKIAKLKNLGKNYEREMRDAENLDKAPSIVIKKNGKTTVQQLNEIDLLNLLEERNVAISNLHANDVMGLQESVFNEQLAPGAQKNLKDTVVAKIRLGREALNKGPGSFAAWYGNIPRIAGALKVIESRTWASLDDALDAAVLHVNRLHPTINSLASGERKYPRVFFTYYTWLRVAHNAIIDMAINHAGSLVLPSKVQYNIATSNDMEPMSFGHPWSQALTEQLPSYLTQSPFGPMWRDAQNKPVLIKPSVGTLDVLSTWQNLSFDPAYDAAGNLTNNIGNLFNVGVKASNPIAKFGISWGEGVNLDTGQTIDTYDSQAVLDLGLSNIGQWSLIKALTGYDPQNKKPTAEDKARAIMNQITGLKQTAVVTPQNIKNANTEKAARLKNIIKNLNKGK